MLLHTSHKSSYQQVASDQPSPTLIQFHSCFIVCVAGFPGTVLDVCCWHNTYHSVSGHNTPPICVKMANDPSSKGFNHEASEPPPIRLLEPPKARQRRVFRLQQPLACPFYKHNRQLYGGPRGCADWCTHEIHRMFSVRILDRGLAVPLTD